MQSTYRLGMIKGSRSSFPNFYKNILMVTLKSILGNINEEKIDKAVEAAGRGRGRNRGHSHSDTTYGSNDNDCDTCRWYYCEGYMYYYNGSHIELDSAVYVG